jgi:hypothetical protein
MAARVPNIAKGRFVHYATLPQTNDAWILVLLQAGGASDLADLVDFDNLGAILAGGNDECDFTGYARRTLTGVAPTVDDGDDEATVDANDPAAYTNTDAAQASAFGVICYDPDTTGGTDADLIPVWVGDCAVTFDTDVATTVAFDAAGLLAATEPA